jgi:hypothetical protein
VAWPEIATEGFKEDLDKVLAQARDIARQEGIYLAVGLNVIGPDSGPEGENKLVIIDPNGEVVVDQIKYGCGSTRLYGFEIQTVETPYSH